MMMITVHGDHATIQAWKENHAAAPTALPKEATLRFTTAEGALPYVVVSSLEELPDSTKEAIALAFEERLGEAKEGEPFRQFRWEQVLQFGQPPAIFAELEQSIARARQAV
jgi:hypothetical protein